jgi:hypothetical protein
MTDDTEEGERPFLLSDGECMVFDAEYLDPETESVGVLAVQFSLDRGLWVLMGRGGDGEPYTQSWEAIGTESRAGKRLRPVN